MKQHLAIAVIITIGLSGFVRAQSGLEDKMRADDAAIKERAESIATALERIVPDIASSKCPEAQNRVDSAILKLDEFRQQQVPVALNDAGSPVQKGLARLAHINIREIDQIIASSLVTAADMAFKGSCLDMADRYYRAVIGFPDVPAELLRRAQIGVDDIRARHGSGR